MKPEEFIDTGELVFTTNQYGPNEVDDGIKAKHLAHSASAVRVFSTTLEPRPCVRLIFCRPKLFIICGLAESKTTEPVPGIVTLVNIEFEVVTVVPDDARKQFSVTVSRT
jgi:hypothetical protein